MMHDQDTFEHNGFTFRVSHLVDDYQRQPWAEEDGHGPVSDWRHHAFGQGTKPPKAPGEMILCWDRGSYLTYDFAEACKIARRDGWDAPPYGTGTPRQRAARAALADFNRLRRWCNDDWNYIGVCVELLDDEGEPMGETSGGLWGIESDAGGYLDEVAREEADEIIGRLMAFAPQQLSHANHQES